MGSVPSKPGIVTNKIEDKQLTRSSSANESKLKHSLFSGKPEPSRNFPPLRNTKSTGQRQNRRSLVNLLHPAKLRRPHKSRSSPLPLNMQSHGYDVIDLLSDSDDEGSYKQEFYDLDSDDAGNDKGREVRNGGERKENEALELFREAASSLRPSLDSPKGNQVEPQFAHANGGLYDFAPLDHATAGNDTVLIDDAVYNEPGLFDRFGDDFDFPPQTDQQPPVKQEPAPGIVPRETNMSKDDCINAAIDLFPGICRDYVTGLYQTNSGSLDQIIAKILDLQDAGKSWPKAKENEKQLKRKREIDEDEVAVRKYTHVDRDRRGYGAIDAITKIRECLRLEFGHTPMNFIDPVMTQNNNHLFPAYRVLEEAERTWNEARPPYNKLKKPRIAPDHHYLNKFQPEKLDEYLAEKNVSSSDRDILVEFQTARRVRMKADMQREAERQAEKDEELNLLQAQADGTMLECGCCLDDFPLNRMVHCDNEENLHWFCRNCAKQTAENEIGNSKYELKCMSMDSCAAGFSNDQRKQFLDQKSFIALERNEQEAMLRMAGIENLESCPFCPYAAEYPPVEINKEFRCEAPDCKKVSCRLCNLVSHIPISCEEFARENGLSVRRQIEEAMSAALIRKCNKCGTPFVKEEGCNKMTCTRNGCYNVQCYVCSKSCGYDHFDDPRRGGKGGNCPLFENVDKRHDDEVQKAEQEALEKIRSEHPEYTEEDLKVKMSENVAQDDARRKEKRENRAMIPPVYRGHPRVFANNYPIMGHNGPPVINPGLLQRPLQQVRLAIQQQHQELQQNLMRNPGIENNLEGVALQQPVVLVPGANNPNGTGMMFGARPPEPPLKNVNPAPDEVQPILRGPEPPNLHHAEQPRPALGDPAAHPQNAAGPRLEGHSNGSPFGQAVDLMQAPQQNGWRDVGVPGIQVQPARQVFKTFAQINNQEENRLVGMRQRVAPAVHAAAPVPVNAPAPAPVIVGEDDFDPARQVHSRYERYMGRRRN